jgi:hypothetical protein
MSIHPKKVPKKPYLSTFIAFATSFAETKPIDFFVLNVKTKIKKNLSNRLK